MRGVRRHPGRGALLTRGAARSAGIALAAGMASPNSADEAAPRQVRLGWSLCFT
jgi:hypothetical protein